MRVYDTPTRWHWEPDIDPMYEDRMIELFGEDWQDRDEDYDDDEIPLKHINLPGLNL